MPVFTDTLMLINDYLNMIKVALPPLQSRKIFSFGFFDLTNLKNHGSCLRPVF